MSNVISTKVKATDLDVVKDMIEELCWLRFFHQQSKYYMEFPIEVVEEQLRKEWEKNISDEYINEEDLNGMC